MDILNDPRVRKAADFARAKHAHEKRLDGVTPYFEHVEAVARLVAEAVENAPWEIVAAAYLHDTIENTGVDFDKLERKFGTEVADLVSTLSQDNRLPRHERLGEYRERLAGAPLAAKVVKLADILHNILSLDAARGRVRPDFEAKSLEKWTATLDAIARKPDNYGEENVLVRGFEELFRRAKAAVEERRAKAATSGGRGAL